MTWGWTKPIVLLPASFLQWSPKRRQMTVLHELAHVKRADWLTQTLAQLVRAVYWFHPLVWVALRRIQLEADRACDDMVLKAGSKASGYAEHLVWAVRRVTATQAKYVRMFYGEDALEAITGGQPLEAV